VVLGVLELQVTTRREEIPHVVCRHAPRTSTCQEEPAKPALLENLELQVTTPLKVIRHAGLYAPRTSMCLLEPAKRALLGLLDLLVTTPLEVIPSVPSHMYS
jgi:hypothetical protein